VRLFLFLNGTIKTVHSVPWPHYPTKNIFSDCWNLLYDKSASVMCDGRLFHSPGPAAANALSLKVLYVAPQCMLGSLWNAVVAHEHRQQDGSRRLATMVKCQTATDEQASQPWSGRAGIPAASTADGALALCGL